MIRKLFKYLILFLVAFFVISCITIYQNFDNITSAFTIPFTPYFGIGLYLLIIASGIIIAIKAAIR